MTVNQVNNYQPSMAHTVKTALKAGAITTVIQGALLPAEAKAAVYNTAIGKDLFLKQSESAAKRTIKNLQKAGSEKMAAKINVAEAVKKAEELYPKFVETGKPIIKELGKSFALITSSVILGSLIADKIFAPKTDKNNYLGKVVENKSRNSTTA